MLGDPLQANAAISMSRNPTVQMLVRKVAWVCGHVEP